MVRRAPAVPENRALAAHAARFQALLRASTRPRDEDAPEADRRARHRGTGRPAIHWHESDLAEHELPAGSVRMRKLSIPDDIRRFLLTSVPSVPHLEAIVLFLRFRPESLDAAAVARGLYLPPQRVTSVLADLEAAGILEVAPGTGYRYRPRTDEVAGLIERLSAVYAADVVGVTQLIHDAAAKNAQRFADAFRLRKDK